MATRITRPTRPATGTSNSSAKQPNKQPFWPAMLAFFKSQQFQLIAGILLLFATIMLLIAYISFFFTGANDMSIIEQADTRKTMRDGITNAMGLPGALIASLLVDRMFGVLVVLPILLIGIYALRILFPIHIKPWKLLFCTLFSIIWGAITLAFAQHLFHADAFFRWGGAFGQQITIYAISYIQALGLGLVLLATIIIFLVVVDKHFVEHCQQIGQWIAKLFRKSKQADTADTDTPDTTDQPQVPDQPADDNVIDIIIPTPPADDKPNTPHFHLFFV